MKELVLDASTWQSADDIYDSFFKAVGAPEWHGRNFNALIDSIETGSINTIEVPYRLIVKNSGSIGQAAQKMASDFVVLIQEIAARGCPVDIIVER